MSLRPAPLVGLLALVALLASPSSRVAAQERPVEEAEEAGGQTSTDEERRFDDLVAQFQRDYLRFTALVQIVPRVPFEDAEGNQAGFDVAAAWLGIGGRLGENVGYFLRGNFARSPSLLEAYVSFGTDDVRLIAGRQKAPFSYEFLTGAADIDFVNRARAVQRLVPGREVGVAVRAQPNGGPLTLRAGVFNATQRIANGGGLVPQSERGGLSVVGRIQNEVAVGGGGAFVVGANAGYSTSDTSDRVESSGEVVLGADVRLRLGALLLAGEYLYSRTDDPVAVLRLGEEGGYATVGVDLSPDDRVLARLDVFNDTEEVVLGYNRAFTRAASFQLNVIVPLDDAAEPFQALANVQLAF